jgi:hypothetical protein
MGKRLDTPEAEGFTQVAAELNWKAARAIARQFLGANKKGSS